MTALTARTKISDTYPLPTNADAKAGLANVYDVLKEFLEGAQIDVASASTVNIGGQTTCKINITGTTTITSFGTTYRGPIFIRFDGALTLTHNATTLILPGGANITTAAGDTCIAIPNSSTSGTADGWLVMAYQRNTRSLFYAESSATRTTTGEAATYSSEVYDDDGSFNPTTGRFTAPVAGVYVFSFAAQNNIGAGAAVTGYLRVNGSTPNRGAVTASNEAATGSVANRTVGSCVPLKLNAGDYVSVFLTVTGGLASSCTYFTGYSLPDR